MSWGDRPCTFCKYRFHSDGKPMEVCWSFALKQWCCLSCYFKESDKLAARIGK